MDVLQTIMAERRKDVDSARRETAIEKLRELAADRQHHSLRDRLGNRAGTHVIAELKKASPSAGLLREDYRPAEIALTYAEAGAACISVLTEPHRFLGAGRHLREVRAAVDLPVLRKDFVCDVYQVYEAAAWGADVVLLIVAALDGKLLLALYEEAVQCGLDVLVESHTEEEVITALDMEEAVIGVNSRNLMTLRTDLSVARRLARSIPPARLSVAESGIRERHEIEELEELGFNGFLIGEALMSAGDAGAKLAEFIGR